jgi:hypothetical protein
MIDEAEAGLVMISGLSSAPSLTSVAGDFCDAFTFALDGKLGLVIGGPVIHRPDSQT